MKLSDSGNSLEKEQIKIFEKKISANLPEQYKNFLLSNNGGYIDGFFVTPTFIETDPESHEKYYQSSNIDKFYSLDEVIEEYEANKEDPAWGENYLPIAYDSSGNMFLLYLLKDENYGKIYFANHEMFDPTTDFFVITNIAEDFDAFVNSLHPYEE